MQEKDFASVITKQPLQKPNVSTHKILANDDFPLEIILFEDGKFYYYMKNFRFEPDGTGKWKFENGMLRLHAKRPLFDMNMRVHALNENKKDLAVSFTDRHGPQTYKLELKN